MNGEPGIYSSRWSGEKNDFNLAIKKVFEKMDKVKKNWLNENKARFICCMTLFWPGGKSFSTKGIVKGRISSKKKGKNGFRE